MIAPTLPLYEEVPQKIQQISRPKTREWFQEVYIPSNILGDPLPCFHDIP